MTADLVTAFGVGAAVVLFAHMVWFVYKEWFAVKERWPDKLPPSRPGSCQACVHWDLNEGQETLRRFPAFMQVASVLSGNQMQRAAVDGAGKSTAGLAQLPLVEDRWEYYGACFGHEKLCHRIDTCPQFLAAGSRKARKVTPGQGDFVREPDETLVDGEQGVPSSSSAQEAGD